MKASKLARLAQVALSTQSLPPQQVVELLQIEDAEEDEDHT